MKLKILSLLILISLSSCIVTTKKFAEMENSYQSKLDMANEKLSTTEKKLNDYVVRFDNCDKEKNRLNAD